MLQVDVKVKLRAPTMEWEYWLLRGQLPADACAALSSGEAGEVRFCFEKRPGGHGVLTMLPLASALGPHSSGGQQVRHG
jgi:hypothetical protein